MGRGDSRPACATGSTAVRLLTESPTATGPGASHSRTARLGSMRAPSRCAAQPDWRLDERCGCGVEQPRASELNGFNVRGVCHAPIVKTTFKVVFGCVFIFYSAQGCWHAAFGGGEDRAHVVQVCWSGGDGVNVNDEPIRSGVARKPFLADADLGDAVNPASRLLSTESAGCWSLRVPAGAEVEFTIDRAVSTGVECTTTSDGEVVEHNRVGGDDVAQEVRCSGP